jgi:hypothetical protein
MHVVVARHDEPACRIDAIRGRILPCRSARGDLDDAPVSYPDVDIGGDGAVTRIDNGAAVENESARRSGANLAVRFARASSPSVLRTADQAWSPQGLLVRATGTAD